MDVMLTVCVIQIDIGSNSIISDDVKIYTATHMIDPTHRTHGLQKAQKVTIGDKCWIGASAIILYVLLALLLPSILSLISLSLPLSSLFPFSILLPPSLIL